MVALWSPEKPTFSNSWSGDWLKVQVELRHQAPRGAALGTKSKGRLLDKGVGERLGRAQASAGVGDEVGLEVRIFQALGDGQGAGHQAPGLHTGQTTEPGHLHFVVAEGGDRGGVGFYGYIFHRYAQLLLQIEGNHAEAFFQLGFILIGDGGENEGPGVGFVQTAALLPAERQERGNALLTPFNREAYRTK